MSWGSGSHVSPALSCQHQEHGGGTAVLPVEGPSTDALWRQRAIGGTPSISLPLEVVVGQEWGKKSFVST